MKRNLLISLLAALIVASSFAQITLRREDYAVSQTKSDTIRFKDMTQAGIAFPTFGNNQMWDYSTLKDVSPTIFEAYSIPTTIFGAPPVAFSNATHGQNGALTLGAFSIPLRGYLLLDTTGQYTLGYATNGSRFSIQALTFNATDSLIFPAASYPYPSARRSQKFPITGNSAWKNDYNATVDFQITYAAAGLNKAPAQRVTAVSTRDTIVGWGTLKMRNPSGGAALNFAVLLRRSDETQIDSFFLNGAPAPPSLLGGFSLMQGGTSVYSTIYRFIGVGFNAPFMFIATNSFGGVGNVNRAVLPSLGLTTANREITDYAVATKVYPNPAHTEGVNFTFDKTTSANWHLMVYNALGQIITIQQIIAPQGATTTHLALDHNLPTGTYFYNLLDETSLIRARGKFEFQN